MPIDYTKYSKEWFTKIIPSILKRANYVCEHCGLSNGSRGYRDEQKKFVECDDFMETWATKQGKRVFRIVLTIAHLNHDVADNREENLKALCQKCHLDYDREHHIMSRKINATKKRDSEQKNH